MDDNFWSNDGLLDETPCHRMKSVELRAEEISRILRDQIADFDQAVEGVGDEGSVLASVTAWRVSTDSTR